jgi:regulatory helix-turn-helix LysR family protein
MSIALSTALASDAGPIGHPIARTSLKKGPSRKGQTIRGSQFAQLTAFVAVAEHRSFTRAAEHLGLSTRHRSARRSAVSKRASASGCSTAPPVASR